MFKDSDKAEEFVCDVLERTRTKQLRWEENRVGGGFIQKKTRSLPDFFLFQDAALMLVYRDLSDPYDVVISPNVNESHTKSLQDLYKAICLQVGVLF